MSHKFNFIKRYINKNVVMGHNYYLYNKQRHNRNLKHIFYYHILLRTMFKKKKYSCVLCSDTNETSSRKVFLCRECKRIKDFLRQYGMKTLLDKIEYNKASAPPYNID